MNAFLIDFDNENLYEIQDQISFIAHLNYVLNRNTTQENFEKISKTIAKIIQNVFEDDKATITDFIKTVLTESCGKITLKSYKIYIHDEWLFRILIISSVRHLLLTQSDFTEFLIKSILQNIVLTKIQTVHILKILEMILKRYLLSISNELLLRHCLLKMFETALSPFNIIKSYSRSITKLLLKFTENPIIINKENETLLIKKINLLFHNNIDNRDGGVLYEQLIQHIDFEDFCIRIWAEFKKLLKFEGEYFQSLLKYFIPITVRRYKSNFFSFVRIENDLNEIFKGYVLLETRRKGFYLTQYDSDLDKILTNCQTSLLGLRIISTYSKKSFHPTEFEINCVLRFLYAADFCGNKENEIFDYLKLFLSQLFFIAHNNNDISELYINFIKRLLNYCRFYPRLLKIVTEIAAGDSRQLKLLYAIDRKDNYHENSFHLYLKNSKILRFQNVNNTIEFDFNAIPCLQSLIKVRNDSAEYFNKNSYDVNRNFTKEIINLMKQNDIFRSVLVLEVLIVGCEYLSYDDLIMVVFQSLDWIEKILTNGYFERDCRNVKIVEAFVNNTLTLCTKLTTSDNFDVQKLFRQISLIINESNMRRPTSMAAETLTYLLKILNNFELKIDLLQKVFDVLYEQTDETNLKIRRNPESRLVIHAICLSESNLEKPLLNLSIQLLLDVLSDSDASNTAITSALHSLEILITDNSLQNSTLEFVPEILDKTIEIFNKNCWSIRNAGLQLTKSLIERFLGVKLNNSHRPKSILDLFMLFPQIAIRFYEILSQEVLTENSMIIFQFFIESQVKLNSLHRNRFLEVCRKNFMKLFVKILKSNGSNFAITSFVSLCYNYEIPDVISEIETFISDNKICTNVVRNLVVLLNELNSTKKFKNLGNVNEFILLKVLSVSEIVSDVPKNEINYKKRIWFNNNIPFLFLNSKLNNLAENLRLVLIQVPSCIKVKILTVLLERFKNGERFDSEVSSILVKEALNEDDKNLFLIENYFKLILVLNPKFSNCNYQKTKNIYKILILLVIKSKTKNLIFGLIENLRNDLLCDLSQIICNLYEIPLDINERILLLKLLFYILLMSETKNVSCYFVSEVTKKSVCSIVDAFDKFLNFNFLFNYLKCLRLVTQVLIEFYEYVVALPEDFEDSETFYLVKCEFSVEKFLLLKIIRRSLEICRRQFRNK